MKIYNVKLVKTEVSTGTPKLLSISKILLDPFKLTPRLMGVVKVGCTFDFLEKVFF